MASEEVRKYVLLGGRSMFAKLFSLVRRWSNNDDVSAEKFSRFRSMREERSAQRVRQTVEDIAPRHLGERLAAKVDPVRPFSLYRPYQPNYAIGETTLRNTGVDEYEAYRMHPLDQLQNARRLDSVVYSTKFFNRRKSA